MVFHDTTYIQEQVMRTLRDSLLNAGVQTVLIAGLALLLVRMTLTGPLTLTASASGALARVTRGSCDKREPVTSQVWLADRFKGPLTKVTVPALQESLGVQVSDTKVPIVGTGSGCGPPDPVRGGLAARGRQRPADQLAARRVA